MKKLLLMIVALMFTAVISNAQKDVYLNIAHVLGANNFSFNQASQNDLMQNFKISRAQYYLSSIRIIHDGGQETLVEGKYILANASSNVRELLGNFNVTNVEGVKFSVGVEAPVNNQDPTLWAAIHPLHPQSPSMHWGWSTGYIFIALEGVAGSNFNTGFEMHGMRNANYFSQTQMAAGVVQGNEININLQADLNQAVKGINLNAGPVDHGANATDLVVLKNFRDYVFSPAANPTNISLFESATVRIYPNPSVSSFYIDCNNPNAVITDIQVFDIMGRMVLSQKWNSSSNVITLATSGVYTLRLLSDDQSIGSTTIIKEN